MSGIRKKHVNNIHVGKLTGCVRDSDGRPIPDVSVALIEGVSHIDIAAITDPRGNFSLGNLESGNYVIRAYASPEQTYDVKVKVIAGKTAMVEFWFDPDIVQDIMPLDEAS
jgi:hypothetical protein